MPVSIMGENGITPLTTAFVLSLMALVGFPVSFLAGFLVERFQVKKVLIYTFLLEIAAIFTLLNTYSLTTAVLFGVTWGIAGGFEKITLNIIWPNYFGRQHLGSIRGIAMMITVISSAMGPLPFAVAYDTFFGGYREILFVIMLLPLLGAVAAFRMESTKQRCISS
ncbi:MFS transporter [Metallumcola ferriviriculae]|uniref:MFS transporter n=1 Tax=Metallumcola ferriviriculae TaxID=3039180 RepID=A0AAU0ULY0_9FIRM|nr:MFS transporter [Desulfitibacteraceae bacterium MK1]